ncbi:MAG: hypothetical protein SFY66_00410 [Oculatellaceae cyanobacterium bins.114]|nr:hypothetical protein [Oculatellaceae cyanobacterium bins.114]
MRCTILQTRKKAIALLSFLSSVQAIATIVKGDRRSYYYSTSIGDRFHTSKQTNIKN